MAANVYDRPADAVIMNTYVPIDFANLYRVGAAQKQAVDQAMAEMSTAVNTFGEFASPSDVDVANYYNETLGRLSPIIQEAAADPDKFKDASFRARWNTALNSLNYANISRLQQGAENLRQRQKNVAEMIANGTYNANWDRYADLSNYNTLQSGILEELSPIKWMDANTLSNRYFDNLQPTDLGPITRNGVRYNVQGITYDTLYNIANARFNDLVRTPQGAEYYKEFLQQYGNPEQARAAFVGMIADSQKDRERYLSTVDPAWLAQLRVAASSRRSGSGDETGGNLGRYDLLDYGLNARLNETYKNNVGKYYTLEQQVEMNERMMVLNQAYQQAVLKYNQTGSDADLIAMQQAEDAREAFLFGSLKDIQQKTMLDTFQKHAYFSPQDGGDSNEYVRENYRYGVQAALDEASTPVSLSPQDRFFISQGGSYSTEKDASGTNIDTYGFANSSGFLLPETIFTGITGVPGRSQTRERLSLFGNTNLAFQNLFESGSLNSIQFHPDNQIIRTGNGQLAIKGTVRIPVSEVEDKVGTGTLAYDLLPGTFGSETTERALKELYGATKVERKIGDDDVEYFEFKAYKTIPPDDGTAAELKDYCGNTYTKTVQHSATLEKVRDVFCFCCFTSLRYSDVANLRASDIFPDYISVTTRKTADSIRIELNRYSRAILEKYRDFRIKEGRALPVMSNQKMNGYLKELCELCGINKPVTVTYYKGSERIDEVHPKFELVGTHAGRRTFICNALMMGIPPQVVMKWTGHCDYQSMKPYIDITDRAKADAMKLFDK